MAVQRTAGVGLLTFLLFGVVAASSGTKNATVLVLGAGASGVRAAATLHAAGVDVLILEGYSELGGRMSLTKFEDINVELGANWIHGADTNFDLWPYKESLAIRGARTQYFDLPGKPAIRMSDFNDGETVAVSVELVTKWQGRFNASNDACTAMAMNWKPPEPDISVAECLNRTGYWDGVVPGTIDERVAKYFTWELSDFEDTVRPDELSNANSFPQNTGMTDYRDYLVTDPRGYSEVLRSIGAQVLDKILLNRVVAQIQHDDDGVTVVTKDGEVYTADFALATFSLGVMQSEAITWSPPLPAPKKASFQKMGFGDYGKIYAKFATNFWGDREIFKLSEDNISTHLHYFMNLDIPKYFPGSKTICFHMAGSMCSLVEGQKPEETVKLIMHSLRKILGPVLGPKVTEITQPLSILKTEWSTNPLFQGAYTFWPLGMSRDEYARMAAPVGRVHFAGEHTSQNHFGFVHGALESGERSAKELLAALRHRRDGSDDGPTAAPLLVVV